MQNLNEDFKNYYKQRLVESILLEVANPAEPSADIGGAIGKGLGRLGRGLARLLRRPRPVPVSNPLRFPPDNVTRIIRKRYPTAFSLVDGHLKWGKVIGDHGTEIYIFQMPNGTWHAVSQNGTIIENIPKDFYGEFIDKWNRSGGANGAIITLPFILNPDGTIQTYGVSDDPDGSMGELPPDTEAIAPYRQS
jgi:hypothetical protein